MTICSNSTFLTSAATAKEVSLTSDLTSENAAYNKLKLSYAQADL